MGAVEAREADETLLSDETASSKTACFCCPHERAFLQRQAPGHLEMFPLEVHPTWRSKVMRTLSISTWPWTAVELTRADNLPWKLRGELDPLVEARIVRSKLTMSCVTRFPFAANTRSPVWTVRRILDAPFTRVDGAHPKDELLLRVFNFAPVCGTRFKAYIGEARISVKEIEEAGFGNLVTVPLELPRRRPTIPDRGANDSHGEDDKVSSISIRCWPGSVYQEWPKEKWIFIIRHGESQWNVAERKLRQGAPTWALFKQMDHVLSVRGILQAQELGDKVMNWKDEDNPSFVGNPMLHQLFMEADQILVSPLARAVQTALLALRNHPTAGRDGIQLRSELREVKRRYGRDSMAQTRGEMIPARSKAGFWKVTNQAVKKGHVQMGDIEVLHDVLRQVEDVHVDTGNTQHEWWDPGTEQQDEVHMRVKELLVQVKMSPHRNVIMVSHSLLARKIIRHYLSPRCHADYPALTSYLSREKLPNCGVLGLRANFNLSVESCIEEAVLLFGTRLTSGGSGSSLQEPTSNLAPPPSELETLRSESGNRSTSK